MSRFGKNLALALGARNVKQHILAAQLNVKRSTVNKWILHGNTPSDKTIKLAAEILDVEIAEIKNEVPLVFGTSLGLTRNEIEKFINDKNDSIFLHNFSNQELGEKMYKMCGIYHSYMPSWSLKDKINCRILKIFHQKDGFYFSDTHLAYGEMPQSQYSGYAFRVGNLVHLVGEEVYGIANESGKTDEMLFASLVIPTTDDTDTIKGISLGSDWFNKTHFPMVSPYCAIRIKDANAKDNITKYIPDSPYVDSSAKEVEHIAAILSDIPLTWFHPKK